MSGKDNERRAPRLFYFETPAGDRMITVSLDLLAELEDLEDLEDEILAARVAWERAHAPLDESFAYPAIVVQRLQAGENAIKVWREYRHLTQAALAEAVGSTKAYISQIETGHRRPSRRLLAAIAETLGVPLRLLEEDLCTTETTESTA